MTSFQTKSVLIQKQLIQNELLGEFVLVLKHFWAPIGLWQLRNWWVYSGASPSLMFDYFPQIHSMGVRQEKYIQNNNTRHINTLESRVPELQSLAPPLFATYFQSLCTPAVPFGVCPWQIETDVTCLVGTSLGEQISLFLLVSIKIKMSYIREREEKKALYIARHFIE